MKAQTETMEQRQDRLTPRPVVPRKQAETDPVVLARIEAYKAEALKAARAKEAKRARAIARGLTELVAQVPGNNDEIYIAERRYYVVTFCPKDGMAQVLDGNQVHRTKAQAQAQVRETQQIVNGRRWAGDPKLPQRTWAIVPITGAQAIPIREALNTDNEEQWVPVG
ncbi:MAG TPA: hypothetical protein VGM51_09630 [Armatimonadota bacterium]|jgi:hypothetical protein